MKKDFKQSIDLDDNGDWLVKETPLSKEEKQKQLKEQGITPYDGMDMIIELGPEGMKLIPIEKGKQYNG